MSGAVTQIYDGVKEIGIIDILFDSGIANEMFPLLLFIGIGAMIDFGPLLSNPKLMLFGAAAQFGIFFTLSMAALFGFDLKDAASVAIIGAADGPYLNFCRKLFKVKLYRCHNRCGVFVHGACANCTAAGNTSYYHKARARHKNGVCAKEVKKVRAHTFPHCHHNCYRYCFPRSVALIGFLMFGNLIRECGVLNSLFPRAHKITLQTL